MPWQTRLWARGSLALQKNISIRRNAQKLAKSGQIVKALAAYEPLLNSGEVDPYDHLYVGDLHERIGNRDDAVAHYEAAIRAYNKLGFHRNGVALCRKIIRLKPDHDVVYRLMGDLYVGEELYSDGLAAYLCFLERTPADRRSSEDFRETLAAAAAIAPRSADMALKLAGILEDLDRPDEAAELLVRASETARAAGAQKLAADLRARADDMDPGAALRVGVGAGAAERDQGDGAPAPSGAAVLPVAPQTDAVIALSAEEEGLETDQSTTPCLGPADLEGSRAAAGGEVRLEVEPEFAAHGDGGPQAETGLDRRAEARSVPARVPGNPANFGEIDLDEPDSAPPGEGDADRVESATAGDDDARARSEAVQVIEAARAAMGAPERERPGTPGHGSASGAEEVVLEIPEDAARELEVVAAELGIEVEDQSAPAGRLADPAAATRQAVAAEQWTIALKRVEEWIQHDPCMEAVEKLVEISRALQHNAGIVRGFLLKGDLLIRDGELQDAVGAFREVLRRDPQNETARRRMARFRELGVIGADLSAEEHPGPVQAVLEARDTVVAVREEPAEVRRDQQDWMEIGALLDEFREGVRQQVGDNDPQAHYDLGVSHQEMGLLEEALEEFDVALACQELPRELELRLRELRGKCFARLERHREAIEEFRLALEIPQTESQESAGITFLLGLEHARVGEIEEAKECMREVLRVRPDFQDAVDQLDALERGAA